MEFHETFLQVDGALASRVVVCPLTDNDCAVGPRPDAQSVSLVLEERALVGGACCVLEDALTAGIAV